MSYKRIGKQFANPHGFLGRLFCKIMNIINKKMYKSIVKEIVANESSTILDVGYGNGYLLNLIYKKYKCNLSGIEVSPDVEKLAYSRNKKAIKEGKIKLMQCDCCDMPFESKTFDCVTSVNTIYFWQDTEKGLSEIYRVLKDNGVFYNAVYNKKWLQKLPYTKEYFKFFTKDDYISLGKKIGFSSIEVVDIKKDKNYLVIFKKGIK